jgi:hypothetical protein
MNRIARPRGFAIWQLALTCCVVACSSDAPCVVACAIPQVAEISVTASNAPMGIAGLAMAITGPVSTAQNNSCSQGAGPIDLCTIYGGTGDLQVTLSAPGYQTSTLNFSVTGSDSGCCGHVDRQTLSVVLQPTN